MNFFVKKLEYKNKEKLILKTMINGWNVLEREENSKASLFILEFHI